MPRSTLKLRLDKNRLKSAHSIRKPRTSASDRRNQNRARVNGRARTVPQKPQDHQHTPRTSPAFNQIASKALGNSGKMEKCGEDVRGKVIVPPQSHQIDQTVEMRDCKSSEAR